MFRLASKLDHRICYDVAVWNYSVECARTSDSPILTDEMLRKYWEEFRQSTEVDDEDEAFARFYIEFRKGWCDYNAKSN